MSGYRLGWRQEVPGTIDAAPLRPDRFCSLSPDELARQRLLCGRTWRELGELFTIERLHADGCPRLELEGSQRLLRLAAGMTSGELIVQGDAGVLAAAGLCGGCVTIRGKVGDLAAARMSGGKLLIEGDAGNQLGGPLPGTLAGMQGGEIVVLGRAGAQTGLRQRRGLIVVAGDAGAYAGHHLRAGTIVLGAGAAHPGVGMQRGTIVCLAPSHVSLPASFRLDGPTWPGFWSLLHRRLVTLGFPCETLTDDQGFDSYSGDRLGLGRGEILCARTNG